MSFFPWTLTTIRAGFRKPTLTSSDNPSPSVIVALKRPVRLCFGKWLMILVSVVWNPRSNNLWDIVNSMVELLAKDDTYQLHP